MGNKKLLLTTTKKERIGALVDAFTEQGVTYDDLQDGLASYETVEELDQTHVLSWGLTIDGVTSTFAPQMDRLCHPIALGVLIENNRCCDPSDVIVDVRMVGGRSKAVYTWPPSGKSESDLLDEMVAFPKRSEKMERSDVKVKYVNAGRLGRFGVLGEHDTEPENRWHLPRARVRIADGKAGRGLSIQVGWWDRAGTFMWFPRRKR